MQPRQEGSEKSCFGFGKKHTEETKAILSELARNRPFNSNSKYVEITDTLTNETSSYESLTSAGNALRADKKTISKYNGKIFRARYLIIVKERKG